MSVLLAGGCVQVFDDEPGVEELGSVDLYAGRCPPEACTFNSPVIGEHGFHFQSETFGVEKQGFTITKATNGSTTYDRIDVVGSELTAWRGKTRYTGVQLQNARLWISYLGSEKYVVDVNQVVTNLEYWADRGVVPRPTTFSYKMRWTTVGSTGLPSGEWTNVCSMPPADNGDTLGMNVEHMILFDGDQIEATGRTVSEQIDKTIFNLGCAGNALAKMHLTGHTEAAKTAGYVTDWKQRQTILRMVSGDYCGGGLPFTVSGTDLNWQDDLGWMSHQSPGTVFIEARWNENGATCLNEPRLKANPSILGDKAYPELELAIEKECLAVGRSKIPTCSNSDAFDNDGLHLISGNP